MSLYSSIPNFHCIGAGGEEVLSNLTCGYFKAQIKEAVSGPYSGYCDPYQSASNVPCRSSSTNGPVASDPTPSSEVCGQRWSDLISLGVAHFSVAAQLIFVLDHGCLSTFSDVHYLLALRNWTELMVLKVF